MCDPVFFSQLTSRGHTLYAYKQSRYYGFINTLQQLTFFPIYFLIFACVTHSSFKIWLNLHFFCKTFPKLSPLSRPMHNSITLIPKELSLAFKGKLLNILIRHLFFCFPYKMGDFCLDLPVICSFCIVGAQ